uniref:Hydrophobin n=1 Tax=Macrostomum lignano TaxID=282301 RepID=A0A1I8G4B3_9PLAT
MILNRHNFNLALLVLGYCLTRCIAPSMSKKADKFGLLEDVDQDACTAKTGPCPFQICPGDFFRAICDQFSLLKSTTHPLKLTDLHNDSVCCKNGDCSDLITNADTEAACSVTQEELVDAIKDTLSLTA